MECDLCRRFYIEDGRLVRLSGAPVARVNDPPPCGEDGCPRRVNGLDAWTAKNERTYQLWMEGRQFGFTVEQAADPLFRWHMVLLADIERLAHTRLLARAVWG